MRNDCNVLNNSDFMITYYYLCLFLWRQTLKFKKRRAGSFSRRTCCAELATQSLCDCTSDYPSKADCSLIIMRHITAVYLLSLWSLGGHFHIFKSRPAATGGEITVLCCSLHKTSAQLATGPEKGTGNLAKSKMLFYHNDNGTISMKGIGSSHGFLVIHCWITRLSTAMSSC